MPDPIEFGQSIHGPLMKRIFEHVKDQKELMQIARMIDILVGSVQVHTAEHGLDAPIEVYKNAIAEKVGKYLLEG